MKKNKIVLYILCLLTLASILFFDNKYLLAIFWFFIGLYTINIYGIPKQKKYIRKSVIRLVLISILSYFIITYGLGLITGFSKNILDLNILTIFSNIWHIIIVIVSQEIFRYIYLKNSIKDKKAYILLTVVFIFLNIYNDIRFLDFHNHEKVFIFLSLVFVPTIVNNLLYNYLSFKVDYVPCLIMRLVFELYIYVFIIFPNLGNYLTSLFTLFYPLFVYLIIYKLFKYYDKDNEYIRLTRIRFIYIPLIVILSIVAYFVSGIGKHQLIAISSGSMEPVVYRGDALIYKKTKSLDEINIGTIIIYKKDNIIISHRVIGIDKDKFIIKTKGDNNNAPDNYDVKKDELMGIVTYNIKYIGFPTIWINEFFNNL